MAPTFLAAVALTLAAQFSLTQDPPNDPTTQPASSQPAPRATPPGPIDDVFRELIQRAERPARITPIEPATPDRPSAPIATPGLLPDGVQFFARQGSFRRNGEVSEFQFDEMDAPSRWFEFTKNRLLEAMENEAASGFDAFVITADVTQYRGKNYITLLSYRRAPSHGNLSP